MIPYLGLLLSLLVIALVVRLLLKDVFPQAILLLAGLGMVILAGFLFDPIAEDGKNSSGFLAIFERLEHSFAEINAGVGLMIMAIGGFVAFTDKIGASEAMVRIALKPLGAFKKYPHLAAVLVIPIGQLIFICVPSAAGMALLMMTSVFPILVGLGVSRLAAASIITGCTSFCIGPASVITASATKIAAVDTVPYFINQQLPIAIILNFVLMITYYFVNKHYDKHLVVSPVESSPASESNTNQAAPAYYAIIPVLPLILLLSFSGVFKIFPTALKIETTTAMFFSFFVGLTFELIRSRNIKTVLSHFKVFLDGMGDIFKSVVTLIIAAEIFAGGLISLGFIDDLISLSQGMGVGAMGIGIMMTVLIFLAAMLMGSGNAAFFAFGPLIPNVAAKFGVASTSILLPMNLSASMGRAISPIAGVLIATANVAKVEVMAIVKRNLIPVLAVLFTLLLYHFAYAFN